MFIDLEVWIKQMQSELDLVLCRAPNFRKRRLINNSPPNQWIEKSTVVQILGYPVDGPEPTTLWIAHTATLTIPRTVLIKRREASRTSYQRQLSMIPVETSEITQANTSSPRTRQRTAITEVINRKNSTSQEVATAPVIQINNAVNNELQKRIKELENELNTTKTNTIELQGIID